MSAALQIVDELEHAATLLHPVRLRILRLLREPGSASTLARSLDMPRQKVNYHLQELVRRELVEHVERRQRGSCVEQVYRARARAYLLGPGVLGEIGRPVAEVRDRFSAAYLVATAARLALDVIALRAGADRAGKKLATATLETAVRLGSAAERSAFLEELTNEVARVCAKYHRQDAPGHRSFRVVLAAHPDTGEA